LSYSPVFHAGWAVRVGELSQSNRPTKKS